jgi:raffinose/stachyose/melibiose transport system substrate-binding protein
MKKLVRFIAFSLIFGLIIACCSSDFSIVTAKQKVKTVKLYTNGNENAAEYNVWMSIINDYHKIHPNFNVEVETVTNFDQYFQKLRTYIAGNDLPAIFKVPNGVLSMKLAKRGKLVNIKKQLRKIGMYNKFNKAALAFLTFDDGGLYLYPEARYGEAFWYQKKIFADNNIKAPRTFDEFLAACETLKSKGVTPVIVSGKEKWQLLRYLAFMPWRVTHKNFIDKLKVGKTSLASSIGMKGVNLLYTMGTKGYFQKGFSTMDYTDGFNMFMGGQAAMIYTGSWEMDKFKENYQKGKIGFFPVPAVDGAKNMATNFPVHAGLAYAFNAQKFDPVMQDFFKYLVSHYHEKCYKVGNIMSPLDLAPPADMPLIMKDFVAALSKMDKNWISWDDKLDPATTVAMGGAATELSLGMISPKEFARRMDKTIKQNAPKFFGGKK